MRRLLIAYLSSEDFLSARIERKRDVISKKTTQFYPISYTRVFSLLAILLARLFSFPAIRGRADRGGKYFSQAREDLGREVRENPGARLSRKGGT